VLISGVIYTGRDAAHKRLTDLIQAGESLPFDIKGQIIYYVGPSPPKPGRPVGAAGPTTSYRMDAYAPELIRLGLKGMIGKGARNQQVKDAMAEFKAVYFAAIGGAGALMAQAIKKAEIVAYEDLGPEAIRRLEVEEFPVIVVNDVRGNDLYEEGVKQYAITG
jgi:fumarate hydratase subunit beta